MLAEGFAANPSTLRALQQRLSLSNADAAATCLVDTRTYRGWLKTGNPNLTAVRLLAILAGFVPWHGWECHRGCLFPPGFSKGGIGPGDFHALIFWRQAASSYGVGSRTRPCARASPSCRPASPISSGRPAPSRPPSRRAGSTRCKAVGAALGNRTGQVTLSGIPSGGRDPGLAPIVHDGVQ